LLTFSSSDLALVSVSGNDLADLIGPLLQALGGTTTNLNSLLVLGGISQAVIDATVTAELAKVGTTYATQALAVAGAYLQLTAGYVGGLATGLHSAITTRLLDAGVEKLVVLNMPNALATPLFQAALPQLIQDSATRAAAEAVIKDLIGVYNVQLSALFAGDTRVIVYDLNALLTEVLDPDTATVLGFSNTSFPTCGAALSASQCSEAVASATVQAVYGAGADWETFLWADTFHPSELAHDVISERVVSAMQARGWR
jgi:phospholipase/lecithinase/hemolysin